VASQSTQNSLNSLNTVIIAIFQRIYAVEHDDGVINIRIASPLITAIGFGSLVARCWLIVGLAIANSTAGILYAFNCICAVVIAIAFH
ncbi:hypothetical protein AL099_005728, partial [Escherichia coli]|nr:hypothetical protein [Escherichia coli]